MSTQLFLMIMFNVLALIAAGFAFTAYEFKRHVIEDSSMGDQDFHGERVKHRLVTMR